MTAITQTPLKRALYRALHDPLTGLANRPLVVDRLTQALARARRRPGSVAVLLLDLDRFKLVNDSLGHQAGDYLLVEMAQRLEAAIRSTDLAGRLGGDEFVILLEDVAGEEAAMHVAHRLRGVVAQPVTLDGGERVVVTASCGVALAGQSTFDAPAELLWDADAAMYRAKDQGRDRTQLFVDGLRAPALGRFRAETALRAALEYDRLRLLYQPVIDLGTGRVCGAEALVRLDDPDRGLLQPAEFMPAAEESGLVVPLGRWVIDQACRHAAVWPGPGGPAVELTVSINLSARQLADPGFVASVEESVAAHDIDAARLSFEMTENALLDASGPALRNLEALKEMGSSLAIDDFGTGHSSLTWLRRLPVDILKIDGSFVQGLGTDADDTAIVRAVVGLGQSLGLQTVAEGVENETQLEALREMGCDCAQGFFFAQPGRAEDLTPRPRSKPARIPTAGRQKEIEDSSGT